MAKISFLVFVVAMLLLSVSTVSHGSVNSPKPVAHMSAPEPAGDIARGQAVFERAAFRGTPGCSSCHSLQPGITVVGPSLAGVGTSARTLLYSPNYHGLASTPEQFLREAILTRQCDLWGGTRHLIIPEWEGVLDQQELIDLTAFLASLD